MSVLILVVQQQQWQEQQSNKLEKVFNKKRRTAFFLFAILYYMNMKKGFTLIELLVVIAIIGILATVVIASLSNTRERGSLAAAQATLSSVFNIIVMCSDDDMALNSPVEPGVTPVCNGSSAIWPTLPQTWNYVTATTGNPGAFKGTPHDMYLTAGNQSGNGNPQKGDIFITCMKTTARIGCTTVLDF